MSFEVVLSVLGGNEGDDAVLDAAGQIAKRFHSQFDCLHLSEDPRSLPYLDAGISPGVVGSLLAAVDVQIEARKTRAKDAFARWSKAERPAPDPVWIELKGTEREISRLGRFADIIVIGRPGQSAENSTTAFLNTALECALFGTPRPVLIVPPGWKNALPIHNGPVLVAWNGSLEADRAVGAALPILKDASRVVVAVGKERRSGDADVAGLSAYLERHGIRAAVATSQIDAGSAGAYILDQAKENGASLLVYGAYTHSRLREFVLGGATQHVCAHAHLPVLMAH